MSTQLIEALRAASDRIRPQGLVFDCIITAREGDDHRAAHDARGNEEVTFDNLADFDAAAAVAVVDRVCAKAHAFLGTKI